MNRPNRGEIWLARLDPSVGAEMGKTRPVLVVSQPTAGRLPLVIVVPVTDWKPAYAPLKWFIPLQPEPQNGLTKPSGADAFQVKSVSLLRLRTRLGQVADDQVETAAMAVAWCVGYGN